eukprot:gnl/TRDRNA2_/TRDRNA2_28947_c0_seq1.p1 gnl/TRDRNA2_/TRDRNA2_28947_c0~~gnl/TRDRNA2_/TRDRNA2_28947_c0_seq1.p1  ORF type:complete len:302 (-),score=50.05 gnl/TRDRNA2_/TRDRNA2_28947_c0_seq1:69-974(-)
MPSTPPSTAAAPRAVLLTGASRGYGRALAEALAREAAVAGRPLHLVLVARDRAGLIETASLVEHAAGARAVAQGGDVASSTFEADLGDPVAIERQVAPAIAALQGTLTAWSACMGTARPASELVIIHNAGTLGRLSYAKDLDALETMKTINLNITGVIVLSSLILKSFSGTAWGIRPGDAAAHMRLRFVNVSSLLAVEVFPSWSLYATGKAARDMLMRCIAEEAKTYGGDLKTLSWAPGPLRTDMTKEIIDTCADAGVRESFVTMDREGKILEPRDSAEKLMSLLRDDDYASGAHIDFYDI